MTQPGTATKDAVRLSAALLVGAATLVVHGWLLLNDGVYWDGHVIYTLLQQGDWVDLLRMFREAGAPAVAYLHWTLGQLPNFVVAYKLAAFLSILVAALAVWRIALESGRVSHEEAVWIAVLAMAYPGYRAHVELILIPRDIAYAVFLAAAWIDLRATRRDTHVVVHLVAAVMFVASFILPSLVALYVGYVLFAALVARPRRVDWIMWTIPMAAAVAGQLMLRPSGNYLGYQTPSLSVNAAVIESAWFLRYAVYGNVNEALKALIAQPLAGLLALGVAAWSVRGTTSTPWRTGAATFVFAVVLLGLAIGPYAAVGHHPPMDGWATRHAQLVGLPLAIAVVSIVAMAGRSGWLGRTASALILSAFAAGFGLSLAGSYVTLQARWVKDRSVMTNLAQRPDERRYSIFLINDNAMAGPEPYRPYEWSSMFRRVWGDRTRAGIQGTPSFPEIVAALEPLQQSPFFGLADVDLRGCEAVLTIGRGRWYTDPLTMALTYTYTRLVRPSRLDAYLTQVTAIEVTPNHSADATGCRVAPS